MRRMLFIISVLVSVLVTVGCTKSVNCRCAVKGSNDVRVVSVNEFSDCRDIYYIQFNASPLPEDQNLVDSVVCTDYPFDVLVVDSMVTFSDGAKKKVSR